jgi:hypothetical protein
MRRIPIYLAALVALGSANAQTPRPTPGFEVRSFVGALVPTGAQRDDFKSATTFGAQVAREYSEHLHLLASLGFTAGHNKFRTLSSDRTDIWQYDAGIEINAVTELSDGWFWRPLVGVGVGGRTYDFRATGVGSTSCIAAYGNVGSELQRNNVAIRCEARDYVNCFESPMTGTKKTRNDVGLTMGLVYHIR